MNLRFDVNNKDLNKRRFEEQTSNILKKGKKLSGAKLSGKLILELSSDG